LSILGVKNVHSVHTPILLWHLHSQPTRAFKKGPQKMTKKRVDFEVPDGDFEVLITNYRSYYGIYTASQRCRTQKCRKIVKNRHFFIDFEVFLMTCTTVNTEYDVKTPHAHFSSFFDDF